VRPHPTIFAQLGLTLAILLAAPLGLAGSSPPPASDGPIAPGAIIDAVLELHPTAHVSVEPVPGGVRITITSGGDRPPPIPDPTPAPTPQDDPPDGWHRAASAVLDGLDPPGRARIGAALATGLRAVESGTAAPVPLDTPAAVAALAITAALDALDDATPDDLIRASRAGDTVLRQPDARRARLAAGLLRVRIEELSRRAQ
jgi:hypothetical protein